MANKRYNQFSDHLKKLFGEKVYKITLDAGFTCPNRDGSISSKGCIFCDDGGSFSQLYSNEFSVEEQLIHGIEQAKQKYGATKFMSYFQAFSNTYKPLDELKYIYDSALKHQEVVGLSIGTRPDCVDEKKLDLISSYTEKYYTWIEYGLQTIHDKSLKFINRGHDYKTFEKASKLTKERNINVCAHVVLGLPSENRAEMLETAEKIAELGVDGVKLHMLCVLKNTELEKIYKQNKIRLVENEDIYVELVCDFLELLPPEVTVHRLAGNGLKPNLIYPTWVSKKWEVLNKIDREFERRGTKQGSKLVKTCP